MSETQEIILAHVRKLRPDVSSSPVPLETTQLSDVIDSISMLDLLCFIEEQFSIVLYDDEISHDQFATIEAISCFVENKQLRTNPQEPSSEEQNNQRE